MQTKLFFETASNNGPLLGAVAGDITDYEDAISSGGAGIIGAIAGDIAEAYYSFYA